MTAGWRRTLDIKADPDLLHVATLPWSLRIYFERRSHIFHLYMGFDFLHSKRIKAIIFWKWQSLTISDQIRSSFLRKSLKGGYHKNNNKKTLGDNVKVWSQLWTLGNIIFDILEPTAVQKYSICLVFLALRHKLYLCICVFYSWEYQCWCPWSLGFSKI